MMSWLMLIAMGIGPYSGQAVHFNHYAAERIEYAVQRYIFEVDRHWALIEVRLGQEPYMVEERYSIVDMSVWGWAQALPYIFGAKARDRFPNVKRLSDEINARPAAQRAKAIAARHSFKSEMDDEARRFMFRHTAS